MSKFLIHFQSQITKAQPDPILMYIEKDPDGKMTIQRTRKNQMIGDLVGMRFEGFGTGGMPVFVSELVDAE